LLLDKRTGIESSLLSKMTRTMKHRGPNDAGIRTGTNWGVGHRRLSIIDISGGQQPMTVGEGPEELTIVFNGEIYNYQELRKELQESGFRFKTNSDTEVILISYKKWGNDCVTKFRGMFSFAIWDHGNQQFFLCRDRMGIKPLYVFRNENLFIFASEIRSILASGMVAANLEKTVLDSFLSLGYVPTPKTMFKGIRKLPPGNWMTIFSNGGVKLESYWNYDKIKTKNISFRDAQLKLDELLKSSVKARMMSEVPLGVFLSGGLDSSAITALMNEVTDQKINTFSVGYDNAEEANELAFAKEVSTLFNTDHHEFLLEPYDFFDSIRELVRMTEEPLVELAAIPLYQISKKAKAYATVLLSGEGSDEIFAGYGLYKKMLDINKLGSASKLFRLIPAACLPGDKIKKYVSWISSPLLKRYRGTSADLTESIKRSFYSPEFFEYTIKNNYSDDIFSRLFKEVSHQNALTQLLYVDAKTWLPDDLLLKADKMTMATSVELRVPFLDHEIVEFAASLPAHFKLHKGQGKHILKKVMEKYLPINIIYRKKMGFSVPTKRWFAGDLLGPAKDIIFSKRVMDTGFFRKSYMENMFHRHSQGKEDYSRRIFSLLVLYHWLDIYT
jgi:asparagine synthase (glutamine-hydrolysing)